MDEDGVAGLGFLHADGSPIAAAFAVVGCLKADEAGFELRAFVVVGIDVEGASGCGGLGFCAGLDGDALLGLAGDAVGISESEFAFVAGSWIEVEDAAGEAVGDCVGHAFALAEDSLPADAEEVKRGLPSLCVGFAEANFYRGVAVGVAVDEPLEAEVVEGGMFDVEASGGGGGLGLEGREGEEEDDGGAHDGSLTILYQRAADAAI